MILCLFDQNDCEMLSELFSTTFKYENLLSALTHYNYSAGIYARRLETELFFFSPPIWT